MLSNPDGSEMCRVNVSVSDNNTNEAACMRLQTDSTTNTHSQHGNIAGLNVLYTSICQRQIPFLAHRNM